MHQFEQLSHLAVKIGQYRLAQHDSPSILATQLQLGLANWSDWESYCIETPDAALPIFAAPLSESVQDTTAEREWLLWMQYVEANYTQFLMDAPFGLVVLAESLTAERVASVLPNSPQVMLSATTNAELLVAWEAALTQPSAPTHWFWLAVHAGCSLEALDRNDQLAHREHPEGHIAADALTCMHFEYQPSPCADVVQVVEAHWPEIQQKPAQAISALRAHCTYPMHAPWLHNGGFTKAGYIERFKAQQFTEFELAKQSIEFEEHNMQQALGDIGVCALPLQLCMQHHAIRQHKNRPFSVYYEQQQRIGWWLTQ